LPHVGAIDVELDARVRASVVQAARRRKVPVVLSHHDFDGTPADAALDRVVTRSREAGADITKVAAHVKSEADCARLAALFARHPTARLVVIGMGELGKLTRVLFPALGSLFTFAALDRATAPGQLGLAETTRDLCRYYPAYAKRLSGQRGERAKLPRKR
jgi:3-dehydroquinate dehydratase-1